MVCSSHQQKPNQKYIMFNQELAELQDEYFSRFDDIRERYAGELEGLNDDYYEEEEDYISSLPVGSFSSWEQPVYDPLEEEIPF